MEYNERVLSNRIKELRLNSGLTQEETSNKLNLNRTTYAHYETGRRQPDNAILFSIAELYDVSTDYLLGRVDDPDVIKVSGDKLPQELRDVGVKYIEMAKNMEDKDMSIEDIEQIIRMLEIQKILEEEDKKE